MTTDFSACDLILPVFNSLTYGKDCLESLLAARRTVHSHLSIHTACGSEWEQYLFLAGTEVAKSRGAVERGFGEEARICFVSDSNQNLPRGESIWEQSFT